ncbi:hypothetical protein ACFL20_05110 [Spirochaetota bacterium]
MDEKIRNIQNKVIKLKSVIPAYTEVNPDGRHGNDYQHREKESKKHNHEQTEVKDHIQELTDVIEIINVKLEGKKSKFRLYLNEENDNILIDILVTDENGEILDILKKDITHRDFFDYIRDILEGEGILFDSTV